MNICISLLSVLLLPSIYCNADHHNDHDDPHWIKFLPSHVEHIVKSRRATLTVSNEESSLSIEERNSTESLSTGDTTELPIFREVMHGYGDNQPSSNNSVRIGVPIGTIILIILFIYCCCRCCRNRETISRGVVIQPIQPPPQDNNQPNIVIQHIHANPNFQQPQPSMVQHIHHQPVPAQMVQQPQQFQHAPPFQQQPPYPTGHETRQQPPYPTGHETRQMLQQEWSPHAPMNQQYPAPDYPYDASAPPPSYGKY